MSQRPADPRTLDVDAAARAAEHASAAAASAGLAAGAALEALGSATGVAAERAVDVGREVVGAVRSGAELLPTPAVLEGVLEDAFDRGAEAWDALRGRPRRSRRWPWAAGSAAAGAAVAVAVAVLVRRLGTHDAPGAQEPDEVRAVVDTTPAPASVPPGAAVDEDGQAVGPA